MPNLVKVKGKYSHKVHIQRQKGIESSSRLGLSSHHTPHNACSKTRLLFFSLTNKKKTRWCKMARMFRCDSTWGWGGGGVDFSPFLVSHLSLAHKYTDMHSKGLPVPPPIPPIGMVSCTIVTLALGSSTGS